MTSSLAHVKFCFFNYSLHSLREDRATVSEVEHFHPNHKSPLGLCKAYATCHSFPGFHFNCIFHFNREKKGKAESNTVRQTMGLTIIYSYIIVRYEWKTSQMLIIMLQSN